jgi:hypothetical protein
MSTSQLLRRQLRCSPGQHGGPQHPHDPNVNTGSDPGSVAEKSSSVESPAQLRKPVRASSSYQRRHCPRIPDSERRRTLDR